MHHLKIVNFLTQHIEDWSDSTSIEDKIKAIVSSTHKLQYALDEVMYTDESGSGIYIDLHCNIDLVASQAR